jgi:hypothetical protein
METISSTRQRFISFRLVVQQRDKIYEAVEINVRGMSGAVVRAEAVIHGGSQRSRVARRLHICLGISDQDSFHRRSAESAKCRAQWQVRMHRFDRGRSPSLASLVIDARLCNCIYREQSMRRPSISFPPVTAIFLFSPVILLALSRAQPLMNASPQSEKPRLTHRSFPSQTVLLSPALRSPEVSLRYSPDGKYLLFQDPSGVAVLSTNPLIILFHIAAADIYPVQFSADSESLTMISRALAFGRWKLPEGQRIASGDLPTQNGCQDGQLSPDGQLFACISPDFKFVLYEISAQKSVFEDSIASMPRFPPGSLRAGPPVFVGGFLWIAMETAFAGPFGLVRTSTPLPSPNHPLSFSSIHFSPDGKILFANSPRGYLGLDIAAKKCFDVPGSLDKAMNGTIALLSGDRAIAIEKKKEKEGVSVIFSLKNGKVLANPVFTADRIHLATNPHFLVLQQTGSDGASAGAFDLDQNHPVDAPPNASLDIHGDELAIYNISGFVAVYRLGERQLLASLRLPLSALPMPRSAVITPNLETFALSVDGAGAIFQVANGQRLSSFARFSAANFADQQEISLLFPRIHQNPARMTYVNIASGATTPSWEVGKDDLLLSGGPVLLAYSTKKEVSRYRSDSSALETQVPYRLSALDPASGKELWKREFEDDPPTPFADPQGERLVLGWKAKSSGAKDAASRDAVAHALYKNAKLTDHDSLFEALDARTGKSVGTVLVQVGNGALSFDSAISVGDALILMKDGVRVSLYTLRDGQLKARLVGQRPSACAETNLLVLDHGSGRLGFYDLTNGAKLSEQIFPEEIAYTHFAADGKRLFVLTEHQSAIILDTSKVREESGKTP